MILQYLKAGVKKGKRNTYLKEKVDLILGLVEPEKENNNLN